MNIMNTVEQFLHESNWKYDDSRKSAGILSTDIQGKNSSYKLYLLGSDERQTLRVFAMLNTVIPEDRRNDIAEFFIRCNYIYQMGRLDMDYSDGNVRFTWGVDVNGSELTSKMVQTMVYTAVHCLDNTQPYILRICYGDLSPKEAFDVWKKN